MMNVRKKEGRSMKRNNYLPATREPEFKGSLSLLTFSICQTSRHKYRQRERGREPGGGGQLLLLQETAGGSAQKQQPCLKKLTGKARERRCILDDSGLPNL